MHLLSVSSRIANNRFIKFVSSQWAIKWTANISTTFIPLFGPITHKFSTNFNTFVSVVFFFCLNEIACWSFYYLLLNCIHAGRIKLQNGLSLCQISSLLISIWTSVDGILCSSVNNSGIVTFYWTTIYLNKKKKETQTQRMDAQVYKSNSKIKGNAFRLTKGNLYKHRIEYRSFVSRKMLKKYHRHKRKSVSYVCDFLLTCR